MEYVWNVNGIWMGCTPNSIYKGCLSEEATVYMEHMGDVYGICMENAWNMYGNVWNMYEMGFM